MGPCSAGCQTQVQAREAAVHSQDAPPTERLASALTALRREAQAAPTQALALERSCPLTPPDAPARLEAGRQAWVRAAEWPAVRSASRSEGRPLLVQQRPTQPVPVLRTLAQRRQMRSAWLRAASTGAVPVVPSVMKPVAASCSRLRTHPPASPTRASGSSALLHRLQTMLIAERAPRQRRRSLRRSRPKHRSPSRLRRRSSARGLRLVAPSRDPPERPTGTRGRKYS